MFFRFAPKKNWQEKTVERVFYARKFCQERLMSFGFTRSQEGFFYQAKLLDGALCMEFEVDMNGVVNVNVRSANEGEGDMLDLTQKTPASYLGKKFRKEYEEELWHVAECCFLHDAFKNDVTCRLIKHIEATYGDTLEFLWRKSPESAIVRRRDNGKWYAVFLAVPRLKLIGASKERTEALNLRVHPDELAGIVDSNSRFPGYHMNKKHWVTLTLDGIVPYEELVERINASYQLALK